MDSASVATNPPHWDKANKINMMDYAQSSYQKIGKPMQIDFNPNMKDLK